MGPGTGEGPHSSQYPLTPCPLLPSGLHSHPPLLCEPFGEDFIVLSSVSGTSCGPRHRQVFNESRSEGEGREEGGGAQERRLAAGGEAGGEDGLISYNQGAMGPTHPKRSKF